jgi:hypothetical protein
MSNGHNTSLLRRFLASPILFAMHARLGNASRVASGRHHRKAWKGTTRCDTDAPPSAFRASPCLLPSRYQAKVSPTASPGHHLIPRLLKPLCFASPGAALNDAQVAMSGATNPSPSPPGLSFCSTPRSHRQRQREATSPCCDPRLPLSPVPRPVGSSRLELGLIGLPCRVLISRDIFLFLAACTFLVLRSPLKLPRILASTCLCREAPR